MLLLGFAGTDVVFAAMQRAAGTDWLVDLAEKLLCRNPRYITYLAPVVTYTMIILAGTGYLQLLAVVLSVDLPRSLSDRVRGEPSRPRPGQEPNLPRTPREGTGQLTKETRREVSDRGDQTRGVDFRCRQCTVRPTDLPILLAAVEMDHTGSTRIGRYIVNHPFLIPGALCIALSPALVFLFGSVVL